MTLPLRYKILIMVGALLLVAITCYTWLASRIFRQEKTALLYDINHSVAVNTAAQLRFAVQRIEDQAKMYVTLELFAGTPRTRLSIDSLRETHLLGVSIFKQRSSWQELFQDHRYRILRFPKEEAERRFSRRRITDSILWAVGDKPRRYYWISRWNEENSLIVAELGPEVLQAPIQTANVYHSYLISKEGEVFLEGEKHHLFPRQDIWIHPLLSEALKGEGNLSGVSSFSQEGQRWFGAYAPVGVGNLFFMSQANRSEVDNAIQILIQRSALLGLIVITLTFLASILFSKRLTSHLALLAERAMNIGQGDLSTRIEIKSRDEIQHLAGAFNQMMEDLKSSRDAIQRHNRELEDKVLERTHELKKSHGEIREMQEKLMKSAQLATVGELAGRTAHEVLNPLTSILSSIERSRAGMASEQKTYLQQTKEIFQAWENEYRQGGMTRLLNALKVPSKVNPQWTLFDEDLNNLKQLTDYFLESLKGMDGNLGIMEAEAQRIHRIVDQMRHLVRSSDLKETIHCHEAIQATLRAMSDFMAKHNITLKDELTAERDESTLNRDELIQVLSNLLRNAYQAIVANPDPEKQKGTITVRTRNEADNLWVVVQDTGTGIAPENQGRIFDQGFTTKPPSEGTGLGLAICRRYARAFGGDVELVFTDAEGTSFGIRVPLAKRLLETRIAV